MIRIYQVAVYSFLLFVLTNEVLWSRDLDTALRDRFLKAVPQTENSLKQLSFRARCSVENQKSSTSANKEMSPAVVEKRRQQGKYPTKPLVHTFEYAIHGTSVLDSGGSGSGLKRVMARNSDYAFRISRTSELKDYALEWLEQPGAGGPQAELLVSREAARITSAMLLTWTMFGQTVAHWVRSPEFQITGASEVVLDGARFVRIDFEHLVDEVRPGHLCLSDGYMICDPSSHWTLREYSATFNNTAREPITRTRVVLDGFELVNGFPIATTSTATLSWVSDPESVDTGVRTIEVISENVPEEEFYLSHYGLPEPTFGRVWFGTWLWYLLAGVACLAVSGAILKRRKTNR